MIDYGRLVYDVDTERYSIIGPTGEAVQELHCGDCFDILAEEHFWEIYCEYVNDSVEQEYTPDVILHKLKDGRVMRAGWVSTRIEMDDHDEWYLVGTPFTHDMSGLYVRL